MRIKEILAEGLESPTGVIVAYHGGNGFEGDFNVNLSGTGEGWRVLGPGMYFMSAEKGYAVNCAKKYARRTPTVYTCEIDVTDFYNVTLAFNERQVAAWRSLAQDLGLQEDQIPYTKNPLQYGRGRIGGIVGLVGHKKARDLFVKHGIKGAVEHIDGPAWEICVFDMRVVKILEREPLPGALGKDELFDASGNEPFDF